MSTRSMALRILGQLLALTILLPHLSCMESAKKAELELELGYSMINLSNEERIWLIGKLESGDQEIVLGERAIAEVDCTADGCRLGSLLESSNAGRMWISGKIVRIDEPATILFSPDPQLLTSSIQPDMTPFTFEAGVTKLVTCSYDIVEGGRLELAACRRTGEVARQPVQWK